MQFLCRPRNLILYIWYLHRCHWYSATKRIGPKTDFWGTPLLTLIQFEDLPLIATRCLQFDSQSSSIHAAISPVKPCAFILLIKRFCGTLSKAFRKSGYTIYRLWCCHIHRLYTSWEKSSRLVNMTACFLIRVVNCLLCCYFLNMQQFYPLKLFPWVNLPLKWG